MRTCFLFLGHLCPRAKKYCPIAPKANRAMHHTSERCLGTARADFSEDHGTSHGVVFHANRRLAENRGIGNAWPERRGRIFMGVYFDYASRGRNDWWRYLLSTVVACLLAILVLVIVGVVLTLMHLLPPDIAAQLQQPKNAPIFFLGIAITFGTLAAGLMAAVAIVQRKRPGDVIGEWRWKLFFWGLGVWAVVQAVLVIIDLLIAPKGFSISVNSGTGSLALFALIGVLVQTFAEEFVFRGYVTQGLLLALKKPLPAAIVSGLLFGSMHIPNGVPQALNAVVFGIVCAMIAIRTGGIALTWGVHLANNYFGAVIVVSGNDVFKGSPGIFTQNTPQLLWWDLFLAFAAFAGLLWLIFKRSNFAAALAG
jgi:uncharacterized protein